MTDNPDSSGGGMPETPPPAGDENIKITNTGQRIRAILVVLIALAAGGAAIWWVLKGEAEEKRYEKARADFDAAHRAGYEAFWKKSKIDIKELKSNQDFELRVKEILDSAPVAYEKHLREEALPVLEESLEKYRSLTAPADVAELPENVKKAAEGLYDAWKSFADEIVRYETYLEGKEKLKPAGDAWLGAQGDPKKDEFRKKAVQYTRLVQCILGSSAQMVDIDTQELGNKLEDTCLNERSDWFRRVVDDCLPKLLDGDAEADETYETILEKYRKAEMPDTKSVFGIETCLKDSREVFESQIIEKVARAWADYVKAQNALIEGIKAKLGKK